MLTITKRPCQLGSSINVRAEYDGDEPATACDIPLAGIMLEPNELNALLEEPHADRALFTRSRGIAQPTFPQLKPLRLKHKFEHATVSIVLASTGQGTAVQLKDVHLAKLTLEPKVGGLTELSLTVQARPNDRERGYLTGHLSREITVEIEMGEKVKAKEDAQQELPINTFGDGEEPEGSATEEDDARAFEQRARKKVEAYQRRRGRARGESGARARTRAAKAQRVTHPGEYGDD